MTESVTIVCGDPRASHMVYAAPFPAADPGPTAEPDEQWKCLGWASAGDPRFDHGKTMIDVSFLESLNPAVRAIGDADGAALTLLIDFRNGDEIVRSFIPRAEVEGIRDDGDEYGETTQASFAARSCLIGGERFSVRRYTTGPDREKAPFSCA